MERARWSAEAMMMARRNTGKRDGCEDVRLAEGIVVKSGSPMAPIECEVVKCRLIELMSENRLGRRALKNVNKRTRRMQGA